MRLISTFLATEFFVISVISANMVASRAGLGGVSWIDIDHGNSCLMGFIFYEGLELTKSPTAMLISEIPGNIGVFPNPSQIFHTYSRDSVMGLSGISFSQHRWKKLDIKDP